MSLTAEQLRIASIIDAKVQELIGAGCDDATIFSEMVDHMPDFKRLMDTSQQGGMDELCRRFLWFYHYAKILASIATGIQSGEIEVPR